MGKEQRRRGWDLVVDAEEGLAIFTIFLVLIDEFVQWVKTGGGCTIHVVPPVANEILLVENCAIRAQERIVVAIRLAHVEHLKCSFVKECIFCASVSTAT